MSIEPEPSLPSRPHIVVVGNHKGGSGKSTVAMHIVVALLKAGRRVATLDLDVTQQTLTHYIENRKQWAYHNNMRLRFPRTAFSQTAAPTRRIAAQTASWRSSSGISNASSASGGTSSW